MKRILISILGISAINCIASGLVNGTISGGGGQLPASVVTNATAAFINAAGIKDQFAQNNLLAAFNDLNQARVMGNVVTAGFLDPLYNPTSHVDIFGNTFSFQNEQYITQGAGISGANMVGTQQITVPIGNLSSFYLVVWYWQNASNADTFAQYTDGYRGQALMALYNTNNYSGVVQTATEEGNGAVLGMQTFVSGLGTNFNLYQDPQNLNTNRSSPMMNGQYESRVPFGIPYVEALSGNTNGTFSIWTQGKENAFIQGGMNTNVLVTSTLNGPYNQIVIGGGGTNWGLALPAYTTNFCGVIGGWLLFNTSAESTPSVALAGYKFATDVMRYTQKAIDFAGSSIVSFPVASGFTTAGICLTNGLPYNYAQMNPDTLVLCDAAPGSSMANYATENGKFTNAWSPIALTGLNTNRYPSRIFETDGPRNDALTSTALSTILTAWSTFYSPLSSYSIPVYLIDTPWDYATSVAGNQNWKTVQTALYTNFVISDTIPLSLEVSSNLMAVMSKDNPPTHYDAANYTAHQFAVGFAALCSFKPWPYQDWASRWLTMQNPIINDTGNTNYNMYSLMIQDKYGRVQTMAITNVPANGNTLRYTNGMLYFGN